MGTSSSPFLSLTEGTYKEGGLLERGLLLTNYTFHFLQISQQDIFLYIV